MDYMPEIEELLANNGIKMALQTGSDVGGGEAPLDNVDDLELGELTDLIQDLREFIAGSNDDSDNSTQSDEIVNCTTLDLMPVCVEAAAGNEVTYSNVLPVDNQPTYSVLPVDNQPTYSVLPVDNQPTYSVLQSGDVTTYTVLQSNDVTTDNGVQNGQSYTVLMPIPSTVEQSPAFVTFSEDENVEHMNTVSPSEVFGEAPKKRGRKRKSQDGSAPVPRRRRPKKVKVYEIETPFEDEEQERKRKNAMNAKRHRDMQKKNMEELRKQLDTVNAEKKSLQQEVQQLRQRETTLLQQLSLYQQQQQQGNVLYNVVVV
ncbi:uncharacterized protein [Procambarus clarkii]|uniref:uncharacterized protein n=1 Tax=Procambarus clarkii TaxID=6728 RepID=UPI0037449318